MLEQIGPDLEFPENPDTEYINLDPQHWLIVNTVVSDSVTLFYSHQQPFVVPFPFSWFSKVRKFIQTTV
jgi:hypothetical protein